MLFVPQIISYCVHHSKQALWLPESCFKLKFKTSQMSARIVNIKMHKIFSFVSDRSNPYISFDTSSVEQIFLFCRTKNNMTYLRL